MIFKPFHHKFFIFTEFVLIFKTFMNQSICTKRMYQKQTSHKQPKDYAAKGRRTALAPPPRLFHVLLVYPSIEAPTLALRLVMC